MQRSSACIRYEANGQITAMNGPWYGPQLRQPAIPTQLHRTANSSMPRASLCLKNAPAWPTPPAECWRVCACFDLRGRIGGPWNKFVTLRLEPLRSKP
jgi:hypothetical protein